MSHKSFSWFVLPALALCLLVSAGQAQDPTEVDPDHYQVELENDEVRVLRVFYGPRYTSVMHEHPATVAVYLTDAQLRVTLPDGTVEGISHQAGDVVSRSAIKHQPENLTGRLLQVILVELKGQNH